jgi:hypothetical protein
MSVKADRLKKMLYSELDHNCDVWYDPHHKCGWMMESPELVQQRLGYNYEQAEKFIREFDWSWIREHLKSGE